ncbi:MAG: nucleotidyltransferase family protein [Candidatus Binataceae bacterium]|jgi:NDP-sugar pyrophosphorylase family protein
MKALILSAGKGERLRPLTDTIPKPIAELGGRPLIHYPLLMLKRAGISAVAINVHHLAGEIENALGNGKALGVDITYSPEPTLLGTGGPLLALRDYFGDEPFWVLNADSILDLDLNAMMRLHRERGALATFALFRPADANRYSRIEIDREGKIRRMRLLRGGQEFDDYPAELNDRDAAALESYMFCGVYICEPVVLDSAPRTPPPFSSIGNIFAPMVARSLPLFGYVHRGFFRTVDDLESYHTLRREFATNPPHLSYL